MLERKIVLPQEDIITGHAFSSLEWERAAFTMEPNHELDLDGDFLLILNPSSLGYKNVVPKFPSEGVVKPNRLEVRYPSISSMEQMLNPFARMIL